MNFPSARNLFRFLLFALFLGLGLSTPWAAHAQPRRELPPDTPIAEQVSHLLRMFTARATDSLVTSPGRAHLYASKDPTYQRLVRYVKEGSDAERAEVVAALEAAAGHFLEALPLCPPEGELAYEGKSAFAVSDICAVALLLAEYDTDGSALPLVARLHARNRQAVAECYERSAGISGFPISIPGDVFRNAEMMLFDKLAARWPAGTSAPAHLREALVAYRGFYYERARFASPGERAFGWLQEEMFYVSLLTLSPELPERQYFQGQLEAVRYTAFRRPTPISFESARLKEFCGKEAGIAYELPFFARWSLDPEREAIWPQNTNPFWPLAGEPGGMPRLPGATLAGAPDSN